MTLSLEERGGQDEEKEQVMEMIPRAPVRSHLCFQNPLISGVYLHDRSGPYLNLSLRDVW